MCNYFESGPMDQILCKLSIFRSGGHFVQQNATVWEILLEGFMWNILVKLF